MAAAWIACPWALQAQDTPASAAPGTLRQAFDAAWARQPEALALQARRDAVRARQAAARAWTPEPAALELSGTSDRLNRNRGARELELAAAVPVWLPGERRGSAALADAEQAALESQLAAAQLRVAATVRDAWWQWQRAGIELDRAQDQLETLRRIAADVARRTAAGELARADQHQADGAVAAAESGLARAEAALAVARQHLRALAGRAPAPGDAAAEERPSAAAATGTEAHAALQALEDQAAVAERSAALAATQSRANPELVVSTTRDRGAFGEAAQQSVTLGLRIPFGGGPRHEARRAQAQAEAAELQARLALERERLGAEREAARLGVEAAQAQLAAAERRATLARESRGFFEKSFRLGQTDLPTRLRIDAEAAEAERQAALGRIELAAAISAWRQTLGLLPQ